MKKLFATLLFLSMMGIGFSQSRKIKKDAKYKAIENVIKTKEFDRKKNHKFMTYYKLSEDQKSLICVYDFDSNKIDDASAMFKIYEKPSKKKNETIKYPADKADMLTFHNEQDLSKRVCFYDGDKDGKFDIIFEGKLEKTLSEEEIKENFEF